MSQLNELLEDDAKLNTIVGGMEEVRKKTNFSMLNVKLYSEKFSVAPRFGELRPLVCFYSEGPLSVSV